LVLARIAGSGEFSDEILQAGREAALVRAAQLTANKPAGKKATAAARQ
jgi:TetR/AcrR family transcriptional repressor of nem operon